MTILYNLNKMPWKVFLNEASSRHLLFYFNVNTIADHTYEVNSFFKILFEILTSTVRGLQAFTGQAIFKAEWNVCSYIEYVCYSKFFQCFAARRITFISYSRQKTIKEDWVNWISAISGHIISNKFYTTFCTRPNSCHVSKNNGS